MTRLRSFSPCSLSATAMLLASLPLLAQQPGPHHLRFGSDATPEPTSPAAASLPGAPAYEANFGQWDRRVSFAQRNGPITTWLADDGISFDVHRVGDQRIEGAVVRLRFVGADHNAKAIGVGRRAGLHHYLLGKQSHWVRQVPTYDAVQKDDLYPGVSLRLGTRQGYPAYDFDVAPYADQEQIAVEVEGVNRLELRDDGALLMHTAFDTLVQEPPVAWQEGADGERHPVATSFRLLGKQRYGFAVAQRDLASKLVVDPVVHWGTFHGGNSDDNSVVVRRTRGDTVTIMGRSRSLNFPTSAGAYQTVLGGGTFDGFVAKFDPSQPAANQLVFSTWLGGNGDDTILDGIEDPKTGELYCVGGSFATDLAMVGGPQLTNRGGEDAILMVLSHDGSNVPYGTHLGGNGDDWAAKIRVDWDERVVTIAGYTMSTDLPLVRAYQTTLRGARDAFVQRFKLGRPANRQLVWSTYLGGSDVEGDYGSSLPWNRQDLTLEVDHKGRATIGTQTESADFPTTPGTYQPTFGGTQGLQADIGIARLDPERTGSAQLQWGTFVGGTTDNTWDIPYGSQLMDDGSIWFGGITYDPAFPATAGAFRTAMHPNNGVANHDGLLFRLSGDGRTLLYSTLLGADLSASTGDFFVEPSGTVVASGFTFGVVPTTVGARWPTRISNPAPDAFVVRLDPRGQGNADLLYGSYYGGSAGESCFGVIPDGRGGVYATGVAASANFPVTANGHQTVNQGGPRDAWVLHMDLLPVGVDRVGTASGCNDDPLFLVTGGGPSLANWNCEVAGNGADARARGVLLLGQLKATPVQLPHTHITSYVDAVSMVLLRADRNGFFRVPLPLPSAATLGTTLAAQVMWFDGHHNSTPDSATEALLFTVQQ